MNKHHAAASQRYMREIENAKIITVYTRWLNLIKANIWFPHFIDSIVCVPSSSVSLCFYHSKVETFNYFELFRLLWIVATIKSLWLLINETYSNTIMRSLWSCAVCRVCVRKVFFSFHFSLYMYYYCFFFAHFIATGKLCNNLIFRLNS